MKSILTILLFTFFITGLSAQSVLINEFQAINSKTIQDNAGDYDDWIEIANFSSADVNLSGCFVTDSLNNPGKFLLHALNQELVIKPNGFILLWADNEPNEGPAHIGFKLTGKGEQIGLFSPQLTIIDSITFSAQYPNYSQGRNSQNHSQWKYYTTPTPGLANSTTSYNGILDRPVFNITSGLYDSNFDLSLSSDYISSIFYTNNFITPGSGSFQYSNALPISKSSVIMAIAEKNGWLNSRIASNIYLYNVHHQLPILAVLIDSTFLFGKNGIYTNYNQTSVEWERYCQLKYIKDGTTDYEADAGIRIQGSSSVSMAKKSFRLFFKEDYGTDNWNYPVFNNFELQTFKNFVLKAGYDDDITVSTGTLLRDPTSATLWRQAGGLSTATEYLILYLNTRYWGIYNIRESINEHYIHDHTGLDTFDLIRFVNAGPELKYGKMDRYRELESFLKNNNFSASDNFAKAAELIDMDYFINLLAFVQCTQYRSWPWGVSIYRGYYEGAKWRFTIWDTDRAYTDVQWNGFDDIINHTTDLQWANYIPKALLANKEFDRKYINRICDLYNTLFITENVINTFDSLYNIIKPEMTKEIARWKPSNDYWENNVENMRQFFRDRQSVVFNQIVDFFNLPGTHTITLSVEGKGYIRISTLPVTQFPWTGTYFENNSFELQAIPYPGYKFSGWSDGSKTRTLSVNLKADKAITAIFQENNTFQPQLIINEICYQPSTLNNSGDWVELYNPLDVTFDISHWVLRDNDPSHKFIFPAATSVTPQSYLVVANSYGKFSAVYPDVLNVIGNFGDGTSGFGLDKSNETILLFDSLGKTIDSVSYLNGYPWPRINTNQSGSIQLIDPLSDNSLPENWTYSSSVLATPGSENHTIPMNIITNQLKPNILIYPNPLSDKAIINLYNPKNQYVDLKIYNLDGQIVADIYDGWLTEGNFTFNWNTSESLRQVYSGLYLFIFKSSGFTLINKLIVIK